MICKFQENSLFLEYKFYTMQYNKLFTYLFILVLTSCKKPTSTERMLMENKWVYYEHENLDSIGNVRFMVYISFTEQGKNESYHINSDSLYTSFYCGTKPELNKWSYNEKDSVLIVNNVPTKVLSISPNIISLKRIDLGYKANLINRKLFDKKGKYVGN